jgi:hypothetical protein
MSACTQQQLQVLGSVFARIFFDESLATQPACTPSLSPESLATAQNVWQQPQKRRGRRRGGGRAGEGGAGSEAPRSWKIMQIIDPEFLAIGNNPGLILYGRAGGGGHLFQSVPRHVHARFACKAFSNMRSDLGGSTLWAIGNGCSCHIFIYTMTEHCPPAQRPEFQAKAKASSSAMKRPSTGQGRCLTSQYY